MSKEENLKSKFALNKNNTGLVETVERGPSTSLGGYFIGMGLDSERYGDGTITFMQGSKMLVKMSYVDWQKLDEFLTQHADVFNEQLDKELSKVQNVKRRAVVV